MFFLMPERWKLPEWDVLLLPSWVSDWLWLTGVRSWQLWMGESLPAGSVPDGFSMFFISISSWWIQRSGGRRSFWLPFLLPTLWVARFLRNKIRRQMWVPVFNGPSSFFLSQFKLEAGKETKALPGENLWNPGIGRLVLAAFPCLPWSFTTLQEIWCWIPRAPAACQRAPYSSFSRCRFEHKVTMG